MKSIGIDFSNRMLCIMTEGQQGTERAIEELSDISKFYCFIPEKYRNHTSYTWNFEDETFSVEQTIYQYGETRSLGDQWRNRFCRSYKNHYGKEIDFPQWS